MVRVGVHSDDPGVTQALLQRWRRGDRRALGMLLAAELSWIHERVRRRIGELLRRRGEIRDYVQETLVQLLRYTPRSVPGSRAGFRRLLARIVENTLRDQADWHGARRRTPRLERPLPAAARLPCIGEGPRLVAERGELQQRLRRAMQALSADDQLAVHLRHWRGMSFGEIGRRLGIAEDAARMRFQRALRRLRAMV